MLPGLPGPDGPDGPGYNPCRDIPSLTWRLIVRRNELLREFYGSDVWLNYADPKDADFNAQSQLGRSLLTKFQDTIAPLSPSAALITNAEKAEILALPRPRLVKLSDVEALILYRNNTTTLWAQGIYTHAQAGRYDFADKHRLAVLLMRQ